jgi:hypothetical protein
VYDCGQKHQLATGLLGSHRNSQQALLTDSSPGVHHLPIAPQLALLAWLH